MANKDGPPLVGQVKTQPKCQHGMAPPEIAAETAGSSQNAGYSGACIVATLENGCADRNPHQNGFLEACFFHDRLLIPSLTSMPLAVEPGSRAYTLALRASGKVNASFYAAKVQTHEAGNPLPGQAPPKAQTARKSDMTPFSSLPRVHSNEHFINQKAERWRVFRVGRLMCMTSPIPHSNSV